jgi:hypothetical protein
MRKRPKLEHFKLDPIQALIDWQLRSIYTEEVFKPRVSKRAWKYQYHQETHVAKNNIESEFIAAFDRKYHKKYQKLNEIEDKLLEGYSYSEIAGILSMTERHVKDLVAALRRIYNNGKSEGTD